MLTCLTEIMLVAKLVNSIYWWQNWSLKNLLGANPSFSQKKNTHLIEKRDYAANGRCNHTSL